MSLKEFSMKKQLVQMFVVTTVLVYFSLAAILHYAIDRHFYNQDYAHLLSKFNSITKEELHRPQTLLSAVVNNPTYLWLIKDRKVLNQNSNIAFPDKQLLLTNPRLITSEHAIEWSADSLNIRAFAFPVDGNYSLVMGISINHHKAFFSEFRLILFWSMGMMLVISTLYSIIIVRKGLRPISTLNSHIKQIAPNQLGIRIPLSELPVELYELAITHNKMLDRLETGFARLSEFSSDIAHELRTPLSNISTQNQVILSANRNNEEYKDTIESNLEELSRIIKTINDVLYIAKAENLLIHRSDEWLSVENEIERIVNYFEILGEEQELTLDISGKARVFMDKNMFERTINNLLSNAIRHADVGSKINVDIQSHIDRVLITVGNFGETIPPSAILHLFDRFYRQDKSRQHTCSVGAGLGLSITQSIVHAYHGTIFVRSEQGFTSFTIQYPVA
ncbi:heavy metal sensor histidine kinase [Vibrio sp. F74]|uniref:heavy metal sensor histidine kinase n=1 Tax=Vibrio sp. F74 TaxID=700020 RepID=UPI0035F5A6C1